MYICNVCHCMNIWANDTIGNFVQYQCLSNNNIFKDFLKFTVYAFIE